MVVECQCLWSNADISKAKKLGYYEFIAIPNTLLFNPTCLKVMQFGNSKTKGDIIAKYRLTVQETNPKYQCREII